MLGFLLYQAPLILYQVIRNCVNLMESVVAEGVEVIFGNLIINMLQLGLFVSPVLVYSACF